jgi:GH15 family glucan-1,4-alpha-glucosidase
MAEPIENYALIGDCRSAALIGRTGSIDWLCLPRFDSASMFARLLGDENHGHWSLNPVNASQCTSRAYETDTFVLVTRWVTDTGEVEVIDFMSHGDGTTDLSRRVVGISGEVQMQQILRIRFDYADAMPWVRQVGTDDAPALVAIAGPDAVIVRGPSFVAADHAHRTQFTVRQGDVIDTTLTWFASHLPAPKPHDLNERLHQTRAWWRDWARACVEPGAYDAHVRRSLLVLRALTHETTGGIVAAVTTSLPETMGGERNWDYRYVWLRDAALTLEALMLHGYSAEAQGWRDWLLRAIAGDPSDVQIMYGLAGERRLDEYTVSSLPGYRHSAPVRVGNGAYTQFQGDIFGEVMIALCRARELGIAEDTFSWALQVNLLEHISKNLDRADNGIWEIRGPHRNFTHSRAMIWAAFDRGISAVHEHGLEAPVEAWKRARAQLRDEIEREGFNVNGGHYVQHYATTEVDASLLQLAQIGFVAYDDPRMLGTVAEIERTLLRDGLPLRYRTESGVDGLEGEEHPFITCAFWLAEQYARSGRLDEATVLMDRLVGLCNDVGLLSEEYDVDQQRQMGNTPQALSHLSLVRAADAIATARAGEQAGA